MSAIRDDRPRGRKKAGYRCSMCGISWPELYIYKRCKKCKDICDLMTGLHDLLTFDEAEELVEQIEAEREAEFARAKASAVNCEAFERYYRDEWPTIKAIRELEQGVSER